MELRQLEYYVAIVREGSLSRAARVLHVSQPALTKQIQSLEHEFGVDLLIRLREGVRPTDAGQRLSEMCEVLLGYVDQIKPAVRTASSEVAGTVTVGMSPSLMPALAEDLQTSLAAQHPGVRLQLVEALPMFLTDWLDAGRLDVGVFRRWPSMADMPRLDFVDIGTDEVVLVGTPGALASHTSATVTVDDLESLQLTLTPGFRRVVWSRLDVVNPPASMAEDIDSVHLVKALVVRGAFCSALPRTFVQDEISAGRIEARPFSPSVLSHIVSVTRAGRRDSRAVTAVTVACRRHLADLARTPPQATSTA